jgi:hypothetical protein
MLGQKRDLIDAKFEVKKCADEQTHSFKRSWSRADTEICGEDDVVEANLP